MECFYELKTMLKLKSIHGGIDHIIMQKLQKTGIKSSSRISSNSSQTRSTKLRNSTEGVFGVSLEALTQPDEVYIIEDHTIYLPKVFVMTVTFLLDHVTCEGIFRKAGSVNRQKYLRGTLTSIDVIPPSTSPHDVAALLKQYLRQLPDPLLSNRLFPVLTEITRNTRLTTTDKEELILLSCLLLPERHLLALKVLMQLMHSVAACSDSHSLMNSESLALVLSPNLMPVGSSRKETMCSDVKTTSDIVRILIDRADDICKVSVDLFNDECKYKTGSHTPWKGYVSDKIRGTWSRFRGGRGHKSPVADQECSLSKRPALEEQDGAATPSAFESGRKRQQKRKSTFKKSTHTPFSTAGKQPATNTEHSIPLTAIDFPTTTTSTCSSYQNTTQRDGEVTIGERVHNRRQKQRDITQSHSIDCFSEPRATNKLPISQSDSHIHTTPSTTNRPLLKAMFRQGRTAEKRKGFFHEPGLDTPVSKSKRKRKALTEETEHLLDHKTDHDLPCLKSTKDSGYNYYGIQSSYSVEAALDDDKTPPMFKSPGLFRKVASEISERFQFTPRQLMTPILVNNDSYQFAVDSSNTRDEFRHTSPTAALCPLLESPPIDDSDNHHCVDYYTPSVNRSTRKKTSVARSKNRSTGVKSSPFLQTPSTNKLMSGQRREKGKLSRRARQYLVDSNSNPSSQCMSKQRGQRMQVSEWIV